MLPFPRFRGPLAYQQKSARAMASSLARATTRRLRHGPLLPSWNWAVELGTAAVRDQLLAAFELTTPMEQRRFLETVVLGPASIPGVTTHEIDDEGVRGTWHVPENPGSGCLLYLH